jgi:hypothetical protein
MNEKYPIYGVKDSKSSLFNRWETRIFFSNYTYKRLGRENQKITTPMEIVYTIYKTAIGYIDRDKKALLGNIKTTVGENSPFFIYL